MQSPSLKTKFSLFPIKSSKILPNIEEPKKINSLQKVGRNRTKSLGSGLFLALKVKRLRKNIIKKKTYRTLL